MSDRCGYSWFAPLAPGGVTQIAHECVLMPGHEGGHRCYGGDAPHQ